MQKSLGKNKITEFCYCAAQLFNPLSGEKSAGLLWVGLNTYLVADWAMAETPLTLSSQISFIAGFLLQRTAYSSYEWARRYRKGDFRWGWERLDRQMSILGNGMIAYGCGVYAWQMGKGALESLDPNDRKNWGPIAIAAAICCGRRLWRAGKIAFNRDEMNGFHHILSYRSKRPMIARPYTL